MGLSAQLRYRLPEGRHPPELPLLNPGIVRYAIGSKNKMESSAAWRLTGWRATCIPKKGALKKHAPSRATFANFRRRNRSKLNAPSAKSPRLRPANMYPQEELQREAPGPSLLHRRRLPQRVRPRRLPAATSMDWTSLILAMDIHQTPMVMLVPPIIS